MRILVFLVALLFAVPVHAQSGIPGISSAVTIVMNPTVPSPNSTVHLTLTSPAFNLADSLISWRVNGELLTEGEGVTSVSINIGAAGESTDVSASVISGDDEALAFLSVTPASIDLLWEANAYTPPFYEGRALPSPGTNVTFVAYPTFVRSGTRIQEKDLVYTWRRGSTVLGSLSGKGRSTLVLDGKTLLTSEVVSVEAATTDGAVVASASVRLPVPQGRLQLYENHPLFGPLYHRAFPPQTSTSETELTFIAVPYFAPVSSDSDPRLLYSWKVNQNNLVADTSEPSQITINSQGSTGEAAIELDVWHTANLFFDASAAWQITFARNAGQTGDNPFAPAQ